MEFTENRGSPPCERDLLFRGIGGDCPGESEHIYGSDSLTGRVFPMECPANLGI